MDLIVFVSYNYLQSSVWWTLFITIQRLAHTVNSNSEHF